MSEAPERIWAGGDREWDSGSWGLDKEFDNDVEYLRADLIAAARREGWNAALEAAASRAETEGVYPELNVYNGGPEWYKHGRRVAAAIRAMKETE